MAAAATVHILCFFMLLLPFSSIAQNISLGETLSSLNQNPKWVSPSGDFAFGFYPLTGNNAFLLGIWFDKIPEKTLVWFANRDDNPIFQRGSVLQLTNEGRLVLKDPQGNEKWQSNYKDSTIVSAAMLDTGNFVLQSYDFDYKWRSFDYPTDTILPTQTLCPGGHLSSNLADTDYSIGRFELRMEKNGDLVLYPISRPSQYAHDAYWSTQTYGNDGGTCLVFDRSGTMYLRFPNATLFNFTNIPFPAATAGDLYYRATIDFDGVFRQHVYPKTNEARQARGEGWSSVWSKPDDACEAGKGWVGMGPCGFNGYCRLENKKANCLCPPEFSYLDENYKFKGCKPNFVVQDCQNQAQPLDSSQFRFEEMNNTDWPLSDAQRYEPIDEDLCRRLCMEDCFCAVAIYRGGTCWIKKLPLSNGYTRPALGGKALIKVSLANYTTPPEHTQQEKVGRDHGPLIVIVSALLSSSVLFNFILFYKNIQKPDSNPNPWVLGINIRSFTYKELVEATDGFKEELGRGAFGIVYKGVVVAIDSRLPVAVKKLDRLARDGEKEFRAEVCAIGETQHKNLVKLLGFCEMGLHKLLVYEFMSNGSLASFLFQTPRPSWKQRIQIAFGVARGLVYLHEECNTRIIHCDIKPQNILLDDCFVAKISDFGLAKLLNRDQTRTNTAIRGTKGYVAPEWYRNKAVTAKVDVYSYGVLLLEIITCRRSIEPDKWEDDDDSAILTDWSYDCFIEGNLDLLVEGDEEAMDDRGELHRMVMVALWCIQEDPSMRPSMKNVVQMLEGAIEVAVPPSPFSQAQ